MDLFSLFNSEPKQTGLSQYVPAELAKLLQTRLCYDVETILLFSVACLILWWINIAIQRVLGFRWVILLEDMVDKVIECFCRACRSVRGVKSDIIFNILSPRPPSGPLKHPPGKKEQLLRDLAHKRHMASLKSKLRVCSRTGWTTGASRFFNLM